MITAMTRKEAEQRADSIYLLRLLLAKVQAPATPWEPR